VTLLHKILRLQEEHNDEDFSKKFSELSKEIEDLKISESRVISSRLTDKFKEVVSENIYSISVTPDVNLDKGISYTTGITNKNIPNAKSVDILNSGTGMQSMYILALLEVFGEMSTKDNDAILIIEEPEVYLHPTFQRRMFAAIRRISKNNQVIFTTHSPIMIADIWLTESVRQIRLNGDGETQIEGVKIENVIDELGIKYEDVLNPKIVVFVEGNDDITFYQKLGLDNPKIKFIATDGFRAIQYFAFIKIITSENVNSTFILLADGDGEDAGVRTKKIIDEIAKQFNEPPENLEEILKDKVHVLNEYSVENYLLNESSLKKVFPTIDANSIKTFVEEYKKRYDEQLALVREGKLSLAKFQKHMKPKEIFKSFDNENAAKAYAKAWTGCDTFLKVKGLIVESCKQLSAEEKDHFEELVEATDLIAIQELSTIKDAVLAELNR
jgi:hypothetical protein